MGRPSNPRMMLGIRGQRICLGMLAVGFPPIDRKAFISLIVLGESIGGVISLRLEEVLCLDDMGHNIFPITSTLVELRAFMRCFWQ